MINAGGIVAAENISLSLNSLNFLQYFYSNTGLNAIL